MPKKPRRELYSINIPYSAEKQTYLKKFCSIMGWSVATFAADSIDHELVAILEDLPAAKRTAVTELLKPSKEKAAEKQV